LKGVEVFGFSTKPSCLKPEWFVFLQENMHVYSNNHVHPSPQHIGFSRGYDPSCGGPKKFARWIF
jgi:hypothetical protein